MIKLHLLFITISITRRQRDAEQMAQHYQDRLRVNQLVEETHRKRDQSLWY